MRFVSLCSMTMKTKLSYKRKKRNLSWGTFWNNFWRIFLCWYITSDFFLIIVAKLHYDKSLKEVSEVAHSMTSRMYSVTLSVLWQVGNSTDQESWMVNLQRHILVTGQATLQSSSTFTRAPKTGNQPLATRACGRHCRFKSWHIF